MVTSRTFGGGGCAWRRSGREVTDRTERTERTEREVTEATDLTQRRRDAEKTRIFVFLEEKTCASASPCLCVRSVPSVRSVISSRREPAIAAHRRTFGAPR